MGKNEIVNKAGEVLLVSTKAIYDQHRSSFIKVNLNENNAGLSEKHNEMVQDFSLGIAQRFIAYVYNKFFTPKTVLKVVNTGGDDASK